MDAAGVRIDARYFAALYGSAMGLNSFITIHLASAPPVTADLSNIADGLVTHLPLAGTVQNVVGGAPTPVGAATWGTRVSGSDAASFLGGLSLTEPGPSQTDTTYAFWMYQGAASDGSRWVIEQRAACTYGKFMEGTRQSGGTFRFTWMNGSSDWQNVASYRHLYGPLEENSWNHIALTLEHGPYGQMTHLYVNGTLRDTKFLASEFYPTASAALKFASGICGATTPGFTGLYDDIRVYNRTLSLAEVLGLAGM